jgi:hypothetical protein
MKSYGQLLRAIIFDKDNQLQALAEFATKEQAAAALSALQASMIDYSCASVIATALAGT